MTLTLVSEMHDQSIKHAETWIAKNSSTPASQIELIGSTRVRIVNIPGNVFRQVAVEADPEDGINSCYYRISANQFQVPVPDLLSFSTQDRGMITGYKLLVYWKTYSFYLFVGLNSSKVYRLAVRS